MRKLLPSLVLALAGIFSTHAAEPPAPSHVEGFEIKDGDRVLFLGDTLLEREGTYGYLETRMAEQFPDRKFTVRNLAFSADTPLGWSRASFDPAAKGFERLKEQLALVKPTVVFLGYGMAASLQEMTDRSQDWTLNRDPARYGAEPMSAARFKKELAQCMDAIISTTENTESTEGKKEAPASPSSPSVSSVPSVVKKSPVRFVLLSPIRHEDLRATRPGLPDPTEHNKLLEQYSKAIEELAKERGAVFEDIHVGGRPPGKEGDPIAPRFTDNGIHLTEDGWDFIAGGLHCIVGDNPKPYAANRAALRAAIIRKNALFFHRWRPANETYLFGFRKREQGQNAVEIPKFDPLIEAAEAEIERLKKDPTAQPAPVPAAPQPAPFVSQPHPSFTLADGLEISLWAENPLLAKPTQCNWDAQGRLWVASSAMYPQIAPGQTAFDKILVLEDTDGDGKAEKSTVFADGLLIPTGVAPVLTPEGHWACYVGQSTELLYFEDTDGDGKADKKRIVFSGFGTEDTHHIVHTLRWGPDGRLYFSQSVYIHTHMETPWGVVRLNSGGTFAYDPRTERVEVVQRGLWNTWGHAWDKWGQSFHTDGAGSSGLSWAFPGATFAPFEGARRTMASISPGSYPKFAGLELIYSPHFPADWQGTAVTCDFRAHKIVHFKINDLGAGGTAANAAGAAKGKIAANPASPNASSSAATAATAAVDSLKSGYVTEQLPVLVQTSDATFRPIDVKLGPDGALYIADWSNPIINHGEVDFRDPRRDHEHGRIWRLSMKGGAAVKWSDLNKLNGEELVRQMQTGSLWAVSHSRAILRERVMTGGGPTCGMNSKPHAAADEKVAPMLSADDAVGLWADDTERTGTVSVISRMKLEHFRLRAFVGWNSSILFGLFSDAEPSVRATAARFMAPIDGLAAFRRFKVDFDNHNVLKPKTQQELEAEKNTIPCVRAVLAADAHPRVRLEAMRALVSLVGRRLPDGSYYSSSEIASLILDAAIHAPKDDPQYEFAAWLSINDIAPQVAEWVEKNSADTAANTAAPDGEQRASGRVGVPPAGSRVPREPSGVEKPPKQDTPSVNARNNTPVGPGETPGPAGGTPTLPGNDRTARDAKILLALQSLPPDTSGPLLSKLLAKRTLTRDGAGPWIELIGKGGGKAELQQLFERVAKGDFEQPAFVRAMNALGEAARLRNIRPDGNLTRAADLIDAEHKDTRAAAARLAGLWKLPEAAPRLEALAKNPDADGRAAAFEGLRNLGGAPAITVLRKLVRSDFPPVPPAAVAVLAQLQPDAAVAEIPAVLGAMKSEPDLLVTWRGILQSKGASDLLEKNFPKDLPKPVVTTALRAARELGRKGDRLVAKLTPLAGEAAATFIPSDFLALAERAKKDGDPVAGEAMYRRMASACTTCHAIGGAGGKLGPDMTSIGASAPPDYIIESILNPAAKVKEGYHAFTFTMKDGTEAVGIPTRDTPQEQFIRTLAGEQGLPKANIVTKKIAEGGASLMPAGLVNSWTDRERLNLYAFLMELGRPGPFDASKNNVARVWQLTDAGKVDGALKTVAADINPRADRPSATDQPALSQARLQEGVHAIFAYTLVDGRLTKDLLAEKLAILQPKNATVHLTARFQAASAGKAKLNLTGIRKAWLDGQPLAIASEPSPSVELTAGAHTFTVEVDTKSPPDVLRLESPAASFLGD